MTEALTPEARYEARNDWVKATKPAFDDEYNSLYAGP
jgi:hypothetical protein